MSRGLVLIAAVLAATFAAGGSTATSAGAIAPVPEPGMTASGKLLPAKLPRSGMAPATLRVGFTSYPINEAAVPDLSSIEIGLSRRVTLETAGLPSCSLSKLRSAYVNARQACSRSFVGHGSVTSEVTLPGQAPVVITGHLLAFYALAEGRPRVLAQVTSGEPLALTYVIPFEIAAAEAPFGASLVVRQMSHLQGICAVGHPNCFEDPYGLEGVYGHISSFKMSLHRIFSGAGSRRSFVNAGCPVPGRRSVGNFPLVRVDLRYTTGSTLSDSASGECAVSSD
jgi:hypothetical protein